MRFRFSRYRFFFEYIRVTSETRRIHPSMETDFYCPPNAFAANFLTIIGLALTVSYSETEF